MSGSNASENRGDPFARVVGHGRGMSDAGMLGEQLRATRAQLAETLAALEAAQDNERELQVTVERLTEALGREQHERRRAEQLADQAEAREREIIDERDRARYAAMRSGQRDPAPGFTHEQVHHGVWTPGRPYLSYQHVWHPRTGDCYRADKGGAPAGELPGTGRHWGPCIDASMHPEPVPIPIDMAHPLQGPALRQTELWWDKHGVAWAVREISDDYLANIITFLRGRVLHLYAGEAEWDAPFVPCPWLAYASPMAWLNDTPLMRALLRERRRRQTAARREARRQEAGS